MPEHEIWLRRFILQKRDERRSKACVHMSSTDTRSVSSLPGVGPTSRERRRGGSEKAKTINMLVKNVPFEATRKDVAQRFGCVALTYLAT